MGTLQFALPAGNGVVVQTSDPREVGDSAGTVLLGEEADEEPSGAFVGGSDETVNPAVLLGESATGMLLAGCAGAHMDDTPGMVLCHATVPPLGSPREGYGHFSRGSLK